VGLEFWFLLVVFCASFLSMRGWAGPRSQGVWPAGVCLCERKVGHIAEAWPKFDQFSNVGTLIFSLRLLVLFYLRLSSSIIYHFVNLTVLSSHSLVL